MADELRFLTQSHSYDFNNTPNFQFLSCIILHDLSLLCSFVVSYPLYTSYFIFFSPYLLRIISFISPLFIAIILLSLLLTTTTAFCPKLPQLELEILQTVLHELKSNLDHLSGNGEECNFEIYNFVFDSTLSTMIGYEGVDQIEEEGEELFGDEGVDPFEEERRNVSMKKVLEDSVHGGRRNDITTSELYIDKFEEENSLVKLISRLPEKNLSMKETVLEDSVHGGRRYEITTSDLDMDKFEEKNDLVKLISRRPEKNLSLKEIIPEKPVHGGRRNDLTTSDLDNDKSKEENDLVKLFEELDRFEEFPTAIETGTDSDKVIGELRKAEPTPATEVRSGSEAESVAIDSNDNDKITQNSGRDAVKVDKSSSWRSNSSSFFGSHGSMKEEKEWRRTLACKLFEERHNSRGGEEGMDSLWEAYETDNSKDAMIISNHNNNNNNSKKMTMMMNSNNDGIKCFDEDDDDEDMGTGQLCCLQALKLSTGKMNLGMKKPNLLKISKALKGFGWLHHVKINHGKKS